MLFRSVEEGWRERSGEDDAAWADVAVGGDADGVGDARAGAKDVARADGGGFDAWRKEMST